MKVRFAWLCCLPLLAGSPAGAAPAPEVKDAGAVHFLPGGVADAAGARGFMADAAGGVTALDLETGKALWEYKGKGRPVAVAGGRVLVQTADAKKANAFRVVGLDVDKGEKAWESDPIVLPEWVTPVEGVDAGRSFSSRAWLEGGALLIGWHANTFYWGGAAPSPEIVKAATRHADGVARVDLASGMVELVETPKAPPPASRPKVSKDLEKAAARPYGSEVLVATAGDDAVAVDAEPAGAQQKVVLKRWDLMTEKPLDPIVLAEGAIYQLVTVPSAGVTLVRVATPPRGAAPEEVQWTAYALTTGKEIGRFTADVGATELTAIGPRAYFVVRGPFKGPPFGGTIPRTLKAVDLQTGKHLWEQPLEGERLPPPPPP